MVAYNFTASMASKVAGRTKNQTIRPLGRKRHARPGEAVQLYTGMRTKHCRKLVNPDPICVAAVPVWMTNSFQHGPGVWVVDGIFLDTNRMEELALLDGFYDAPMPVFAMAEFFLSHYGEQFEGVLIRWQIASEAAQ